MTGPLSASERIKYQNVWATTGYEDFSPGEKYADTFRDYIRELGKWPHDIRVLDAGCGAGKGSLALAERNFMVTSLDIVKPADFPPDMKFIEANLWRYWPTGRKFDWIYCCDVMEHIPTEMVGLVLDRFKSAATNAWLAIALVPDNKILAGELHLTVCSYVWWRDFLASFGTVEDARDCWHTGIYHVRF